MTKRRANLDPDGIGVEAPPLMLGKKGENWDMHRGWEKSPAPAYSLVEPYFWFTRASEHRIPKRRPAGPHVSDTVRDCPRFCFYSDRGHQFIVRSLFVGICFVSRKEMMDWEDPRR